MTRVIGGPRRWSCFALLVWAVVCAALAGPARAAPTPSPVATAVTSSAASAPTDGVTAPTAPTAPSVGGDGSVTIDVGGKPSTSMSVLLLITVVSVAPSILLMTTSFTKIFVVLSLTRNALGLTTVPPNQVLAGLSLFLSAFVMRPTWTKIYDAGVKPYLDGTKTRDHAFADGLAPLRDFMLAHTRPDEIALMLRAADLPNPTHATDVDTTTLIPAFVLSELRSAMIIGFVIYLPFLVIDLVVSSSLMSLGMMMLPPVSVSLPFKLLLFVVVDGWGLVVTSIVSSYKTG